MKELSDGTQVVARMYYYLLDFNDMTNWDYIRNVLIVYEKIEQCCAVS
jgi:hypothetical protein